VMGCAFSGRVTSVDICVVHGAGGLFPAGFRTISEEMMSLIYIVIISAGQQSDSVIHIHTSILFQILFPHG